MAYRPKILRNSAIFQMLCGSLMILLGIGSIFAVHHWSTYAGFGVWVGFWVIISGVLGYIGAKEDTNPNKCLIGCFLGFSITACVIGVIMFISYCFAVSQFSRIVNCREDWLVEGARYKRPCSDSRSSTKRGEAADGMGLGVCQLILSALVFFVGLLSSIYSCKAVCCGTSGHTATTQHVLYAGTQPMHPAGQAGVVFTQPTSAIATTLHGVPVTGQQAAFLRPQQEPKEHERPPPYSYDTPTGNTPPQEAFTSGVFEDMSPPYSYSVQTGNAPPSTASAGGVTEDVHLPYSYSVQTGNVPPSTVSAGGVTEDVHLPYSYSAQTGNAPPSAASVSGAAENMRMPAWVETI
ncbi:hypothetical protein ABFA07_018082 [Porites harrisoni]